MQEYSVFITDEKRTSSGSGVLFYPGSGSNLYIFTCAHVLDNLEEPFQIYSLLPLNREQELYRVEKLEAMREQVKYSPIDKVSESAGGVIEHSIDAAVICLEIKKEISLETTDYVIGEARKGDGVLAQGFPGSETEIEELLNYVEGTYGRILHNANDKEVLLWQIEDAHVDSGNRVYIVMKLVFWTMSMKLWNRKCRREVFWMGMIRCVGLRLILERNSLKK